jgi:hypothetical protein
MNTIESFRDEFFFLSNMYPIDITYKGTQFNSVEQDISIIKQHHKKNG